MTFTEAGQRDGVWVFRRSHFEIGSVLLFGSLIFVLLGYFAVRELFKVNSFDLADSNVWHILVFFLLSLVVLVVGFWKVWTVDSFVVDPSGRRVSWSRRSPFRLKTKSLGFDDLGPVQIRHSTYDGEGETLIRAQVTLRLRQNDQVWLVLADDEKPDLALVLAFRVANLMGSTASGDLVVASPPNRSRS